MKHRVALAAACVCLIICTAFLYISTNATVAANAVSVAEGLLKMCRMSADLMDTAAFLESPEKSLQGLSVQCGVGITVISADGYVTQDTRQMSPKGSNVSESPEIVQARENGEGYDIREYHGTQYIYAAHQLEDGSFVRLYQVGTTASKVLAGRMGKFVLLLMAAFSIAYLANLMANHGLFAFYEHTARLLDAFAEGQFEQRIARISGEPRDYAARINSAAGRIEDQLIRKHRHSQAMSEVMSRMQNGILAVDQNLNVTFVTPPARQMLGMTTTTEGMPIQEASRDVKIDQILLAAMEQDGVYTNEVAARTGVGRSHRPLRLYVSAMRQDDQNVGAVALIEDITELRRLEQIRTDFAANVSHELKTPLTSIKGFVETLQEGAIENPPMARKFLRIIMMEADRLTRLINDILTITKFESGTDEVPLAPIPLDQRAFEVCEMLEFHAGDKQITLKAPQVSNPHVFIMGNPDRVQQMLINLIENAIKYNQPGGSVTVSVYASQDNAQFLVADTGIGIAEEHIPRLFERFYRVDKGRSRSMGGTGLGLAIVKHIVKSMGGMIEVHSKLGEGTEFLVTLPLCDQPQQPEEKQEEEE